MGTYIQSAGFKVLFWKRTCQYAANKKLLVPLYIISRLKFRRVQVKYGIQMNWKADIAPGTCIVHYGGILISPKRMDKGCVIRTGVVIGKTDKGNPIIGENCQIGVNATLIGNITIGNNCTIGAGSVVTKSFPDNSIIAGNPAKVIGYNLKDNIRF